MVMSGVTERLCALQVLRALAAGAVIFSHAQDTYITKVASAWLPLSSFALGDLGVKLFFCISGFMIAGAGARMAPGAGSVAEFAWRRVVRVVPLYWAVTFVYAAKLAWQGDPPTVGELTSSLSFIAHNEYVIRPILGVGWTLNFEMFFYAVFAFSLFLDRKLRGSWVAACFLIMFVMKWDGLTAPPGSAPVGSVPAGFLYLLTNICLVYFLIGMLLAWARQRCMRLIVAAGLPAGWALLLAAAVLGAYLSLLALEPWLGWLPWWAGWGEVVLALVVVLAVGACLLEKVGSGGPEGRVFTLLQRAGDASYSSYLTHGFVMGPAARLLSFLGVDMPVVVFSAAMVVACTAVGLLVHHVFEKPLLKRFSTPPWLALPARPVFQAPKRSSSSGR